MSQTTKVKRVSRRLLNRLKSRTPCCPVCEKIETVDMLRILDGTIRWGCSVCKGSFLSDRVDWELYRLRYHQLKRDQLRHKKTEVVRRRRQSKLWMRAYRGGGIRKKGKKKEIVLVDGLPRKRGRPKKVVVPVPVREGDSNSVPLEVPVESGVWGALKKLFGV